MQEARLAGAGVAYLGGLGELARPQTDHPARPKEFRGSGDASHRRRRGGLACPTVHPRLWHAQQFK